MKLEANLRSIEVKFGDVAPEAYALYKSEVERKEAPRHQRTGSRRIEPPSDPSTLTVPATATLLADAQGVGGYLGIFYIRHSVINFTGPTSPWLFLQETRIYASRVLSYQTTIASGIPDFLKRDAIHIGTIQHEYSPVSADKRLQYFNGNIISPNYSLRLIHTCSLV